MASNDDIASNLSDTLNESVQRGVQRYRIRNREVENYKPTELIKAMQMMQGLASSKRGVNVARRTDVR